MDFPASVVVFAASCLLAFDATAGEVTPAAACRSAEAAVDFRAGVEVGDRKTALAFVATRGEVFSTDFLVTIGHFLSVAG